MKHILYIGLDVHKDSIAIAIAESGRNGELRSWGNISNSVPAIKKAIARIRKQYGLEIELHFCYEAGPCGFVLARRLQQLGHECIIVAPSKIPRQSGDKIKTDRRDADHWGSGEPGGDCRRQPRSGETSGSERIKSWPGATALEISKPSTSRKPPTRPSETCVGLGPMRWTINVVPSNGSKPFYSSTATITKVEATGEPPTCATSETSLCPIRL